ncbi:MAG: cytochrome c [Planctomycetota bacterium]|nr:cytochrome c [Planctomycetota bacterium]
MPPWVKPLGVTVAFLAMIPFAVIARARVTASPDPRIHIIRDMDSQAYFKAQASNPLFADGRAMRPPVPGTVARGEDELDDHRHRGTTPDGATYVDAFPEGLTVDAAFLERGRGRYQVFCAPCHGVAGYGDGPVHHQALAAINRGRPGMEWVTPTSLHAGNVRGFQVGRIFHVITNGVRNMAPYGAQVPVDDRWAIAAYVKALQASQRTED